MDRRESYVSEDEKSTDLQEGMGYETIDLKR
jgi:hypothetical protein